ncbi:MAG: FtsX-like permease family protein [Ignisphaera sp.]
MRGVKEKVVQWLLIATCVLIATSPLADSITSPLISSGTQIREYRSLSADDFKKVINMIDYDNIFKHISSLVAYESRVTGYEGCEKSAEYIANIFKTLNLTVEIQEYKVLSPIDKGSAILYSENGSVNEIPAYAIWPNYVVTGFVPSSKPIRGRLLYVGKGDLKDFNGEEVEGSIVLMDFNSGDNWKNAMKLGAKAVIFLEPMETSYREAISKFSLIPVHFPRLYVQRRYAAKLLELALKRAEVEVYSNMKWEEVTAKNVIGIIEGSERPNDVIIVAAHYDTWSVVPKLAPGADEAVSVASLLELARIFSILRPKYTIWFVALSGHWLALAGAREFVENYFFDWSVLNGSKKLWAFIALDFSTDSTKLNLLYAGHFYEYTGGAITPIETRWTRWLEPKIFREVLPRLEEATGRRYDVESGFMGIYGWWGSVYGPYMLDSEPFAIAHGLGFAIRTVGLREHWGHPLSTVEKVQLKNLKPQLEVAAAIVFALAEEGVGMRWEHVSPARALYVAGGAEVAGYITLHGRVLKFNYSKGWYDPVPNAIVAILRGGPGYTSYPFSRILVKSDEKGEFIVHGIGGLFAVSHAGWGGAQIYVEAYKIDDETGLIVYAPDLGQYGQMQIPFYYQPDRHPFNVSTVVFECSSIVIFDVGAPMMLAPKIFFDPRFESWHYGAWHSIPFLIQVLDFNTLGPFLNWGSSYLPFDDIAVVFVPPNSRAAILYKLTAAYRNVGILVNASEWSPEGEGIHVSERTQLVIPLTAYRFAEEAYLLSLNRYSKLTSRFVLSYVAEQHLSESSKWLNEARKALAERRYDAAYTYAKLAWIRAFYAYEEVMRLLYDTVNVNSIFLIVAVIFAALFETLVIGASGKSKMVSLTVILITLIILFYFVHPAPQVASVYWMAPLSVGILLLLLFVSLLFMSRAREITLSYREALAGKHFFVEVSRVDLMLTLFSTSIQFMKKRKIRTILTLIIVVTVIFSLLSLTSTVYTTAATLTRPTIYSPSYKGILITRPTPLKEQGTTIPGGAVVPILSYGDLDLIKTLIRSDKFSVRVWWYPQSVRSKAVYATLVGRNGSYNIKAILGLSPDEVLDLRQAIINGSWLPSFAENVCILPVNIAKSLGVSVGDQVWLEGYNLNLTVVGILDPRVANVIKDLDAYPVTPPSPDSIAALLRGFIQEQQWLPLSFEEVIVVPYQILLDKGGFIASVAAQVEDFEALKEKAAELAMYFELIRMYISDGKDVLMVSPFLAFGFYGWANLAVPLLIAALMLTNVILGNVRERRREVETFSALGLAPREVSWFFVAEALVFSLIGYVIGYLLGLVSNIILFKSKLLPPNFIVNISSLATILSLMIGLLAILAPSVYPAIMVSRTVVPSLERKWKVPTKPRGDEWEIPLPYAAVSKEEALGFLEFLREFFDFHRKESVEVFITDDISFDMGNLQLVVVSRLQPLESGVVQKATFSAIYLRGEGRYTFLANVKLLSGKREAWLAKVPAFIDSVRKQMLMWRGLTPTERAKYVAKVVS